MKNNKGISMVTLIITIVVILILSATMIVSVSDYTDTSGLMNMRGDIQLLKDKVIVYYNTYGEVPGCIETYYEEIATDDTKIIIYKNAQNTEIDSGFIASRDANDGDVYYQIDVTKLSNVTLNLGTDEDVYIINEKTLNVYYINGVESEGVMHYTY